MIKKTQFMNTSGLGAFHWPADRVEHFLYKSAAQAGCIFLQFVTAPASEFKPIRLSSTF